MNRFLKYFRISGCLEAFSARVVSYADDFVILTRGRGLEALNRTRSVITRLGLQLNEDKTCLKDALEESFDFLGYTFGPHRYKKGGHWYLGGPSKKSIRRLKQKIRVILQPGNMGAWPEVRGRLNRLLTGWSTCFSYGPRLMAYRTVDNYVYERVRHFLVRRHKVPSRGTRRCPVATGASSRFTT